MYSCHYLRGDAEEIHELREEEHQSSVLGEDLVDGFYASWVLLEEGELGYSLLAYRLTNGVPQEVREDIREKADHEDEAEWQHAAYSEEHGRYVSYRADEEES